MAEKRIYKVQNSGTPSKLIRASSKAEIRAHLTRLYTIEVATPDDVAELYAAGSKVEEAVVAE